MRILFWGAEGVFSQQVLAWLAERHAVQAVMLPASPLQRQAVQPLSPPTALAATAQAETMTTAKLAWQHALPTYGLRALREPSVAELLHTLAPDLVCVACFPWRVPATLLTIPTFGFVNLHPSLLPAYRGPAPIFWQLRDGLRTIGITAHWMDADFDTGAIVDQRAVPLPTGCGGPAIDRLAAAHGVRLLASLLDALARGHLPHHPQPATGTAHPWPNAADFTLNRHWSALHAFNFMRGTAEWQHPYPLHHDGHTYLLHTAIAHAEHATIAPPVQVSAAEISIQFAPGVLSATLQPTSNQRMAVDLLL